VSSRSATPRPPRCAHGKHAAGPRAIVSYALHRLTIIIAAYQAFLDRVRARDDVSFALVVALLAAETHRRADAEAALAGGPGAAAPAHGN